MQYPITRIAILIGAPGGGTRSKYLPGVNEDLKNVLRYLRSSRGGYWYDEEIITIPDATYVKVISVINSIFADYVLVYFSGHGFTDYYSKERILCLQDENIPDTFLINDSLRQLIIADACRTVLGASIGSIPAWPGEYLNYTGPDPRVRQLFDQCIQYSPAGKIIVHGTQNGNEAKDSMYGGIFTNSLLHVGYRMNTAAGYTPCTIQQVMHHVPSVLFTEGSDQQPELYFEGVLQVPFAIGMPSEEQVRSIQHSKRRIFY